MVFVHPPPDLSLPRDIQQLCWISCAYPLAKVLAEITCQSPSKHPLCKMLAGSQVLVKEPPEFGPVCLWWPYDQSRPVSGEGLAAHQVQLHPI